MLASCSVGSHERMGMYNRCPQPSKPHCASPERQRRFSTILIIVHPEDMQNGRGDRELRHLIVSAPLRGAHVRQQAHQKRQQANHLFAWQEYPWLNGPQGPSHTGDARPDHPGGKVCPAALLCMLGIDGIVPLRRWGECASSCMHATRLPREGSHFFFRPGPVVICSTPS
ncbi:hypothetical protein PYCCODRAFT_1014693 [Trametes coccinea BRFM310]|uniref:Uncharacterized protein n=1 Tax=Trametes coccinea (strain BRFM310) TaxID=1353009 RepID=A0A1Y2ICY4_TRAC3|nr:hypothetical protein PYCCODRAFT_1014693 [Trametes coccinea BRFM310]